MNVSFIIKYTTHDKVKFAMGIASIVFSILAMITLGAFVYFLRQNYIYEKYALEARVKKREMIKF